MSEWKLTIAEIMHTLRGEVGNLRDYVSDFRYRYKSDGGSPSEDVLEFVDDLRARQVRLLGTIDRIHEFARPSRRLERVDLCKLVESVVSDWKQRAGRTVQYSVGDQHMVVSADSSRLREVFMELLSNAREAVTGDEECLVIKVGIFKEIATTDSGWARIDVEDNAGGVSPEILADIFKRYRSTKSGRGRGLGLAIARSIIEGHGGSINVDVQPGIGTRFFIRLPLLAGERSCT